MVFPDALILHTMRDPLDTLFRYSCCFAAEMYRKYITSCCVDDRLCGVARLPVLAGIEDWVLYGINCL
jgi:hypothetical protein